jgi:hypothetical protein
MAWAGVMVVTSIEKPSLLLERVDKTCNVKLPFKPSPLTLKVLDTFLPSATVSKSSDVGLTVMNGSMINGFKLSETIKSRRVELELVSKFPVLDESNGDAQHWTTAMTRTIARSSLCFIAC